MPKGILCLRITFAKVNIMQLHKIASKHKFCLHKTFVAKA